VGHAHAAADGDVPAQDLAVAAHDGDEAQVVREHVDVVVGRDGDYGLELTRQVGTAVDGLVVDRVLAHDPLAVEPELAVGAGLGQEMRADPGR
jgi:hypothetical protein